MRFRYATFGLALFAVGCGGQTSSPVASTQSPAGGSSSGGAGGGSGLSGTNGGPFGGFGGSGGGVIDEKLTTSPPVDKVDLLFAIDNSSSMADKQRILALAVPDLVNRFVNPPCVDASGSQVAAPPDPESACPSGSAREITPMRDVHIGIVTSSLGGGGADACAYDPSAPASASNSPSDDDSGHLVHRRSFAQQNGDYSYPNQVSTYQACPPGTSTLPGAKYPCTPTESGFLAWDPGNGAGSGFVDDPPGESNVMMLDAAFVDMVQGVDQKGCGYEAQMEGWYRFLVDPNPVARVTVPNVGAPPNVTYGDPVIATERAEFLRPDSLVVIVLLSDEDEHSFVVGALPSMPPCSGGATDHCWPDSYRVQDNYGADGTPFQYNYLQNQVRLGGGQFLEWSGTTACATDPYSPDCKECLSSQAGPGCVQLSAADDGTDLRQWKPKQRFGWDPQTPMQKYVDALTQPDIIDFSSGARVPNPLFDDLPYNAALAAQTPLGRGKYPQRSPSLVFFATLTGVPWQDITRLDSNGKPDLSLGYLGAAELAMPHPAGITKPDGTPATGWDLVLGNPYEPDPSKRSGPLDPTMIDRPENSPFDPSPRFAAGAVHPVTKEPLGTAGWNSINGHDWHTGTNDLEYACIFPLAPDPTTGAAARDCEDATSCDCYVPGMHTAADLQKLDNPLCEPPLDPGDPSKGGAGQQAIKLAPDGSGLEYWAKAYPGPRYLEIQRRLANAGGNPIVASICARNVTDPTANDFGYRPAIAAIFQRLRAAFAPPVLEQCLPAPVAVDASTGAADCVVLAAKYAPIEGASPADVTACQQGCQPGCSATGTCGHARADVPADVMASLDPSIKAYQCLCAVPQLAGGDRTTCQSDATAKTLADMDGGYCYVDPQPPNAPAGAANLVMGCPSTPRQAIRFVDADLEGATVYISCRAAGSM